jgi:hypothetical protein
MATSRPSRQPGATMAVYRQHTEGYPPCGLLIQPGNDEPHVDAWFQVIRINDALRSPVNRSTIRESEEKDNV